MVHDIREVLIVVEGSYGPDGLDQKMMICPIGIHSPRTETSEDEENVGRVSTRLYVIAP